MSMATLQSVSKRVDDNSDDVIATCQPIIDVTDADVSTNKPINGKINTKDLAHGEIGAGEVQFTIEGEEDVSDDDAQVSTIMYSTGKKSLIKQAWLLQTNSIKPSLLFSCFRCILFSHGFILK